jgi:hypothetical protein
MFHVKLWNFPIAGDGIEAHKDTPRRAVGGVEQGRL